MHDAIEALGERLARRVANERAFGAHSAHALRTPLAGIDLQLAVAEREAPPALQPRLARARGRDAADARGRGAAGAVSQRRGVAAAAGFTWRRCWRGCRTSRCSCRWAPTTSSTPTKTC
ncbi:MAG: hypothetical protein IPM99_18555 [Rubrivivax sp.]|nr:hypothetical protein [Rubrivivax sp.]